MSSCCDESGHAAAAAMTWPQDTCTGTSCLQKKATRKHFFEVVNGVACSILLSAQHAGMAGAGCTALIQLACRSISDGNA